MEQRDFFLRISVVPLNSFNTKSFYKNNNYILTTKQLLLQTKSTPLHNFPPFYGMHDDDG